MVVGDPIEFALESAVTRALEPRGQMGLGYFAIHVGARRYGVVAPDATLLACSFGEVEKRIRRRGSHQAPFAQLGAGDIADALGKVVYGGVPDGAEVLGRSAREFNTALAAGHLVWAPDGDEAFDDGSLVLQFDVANQVRLVGFRRLSDQRHDPSTLADVWLDADRYYGILATWSHAFEAEWRKSRPAPA